MKHTRFVIAILALTTVMLTGCGTIGGTVGGMGEDLTKAGNWIKSR